jgi:hypothetical protein
MSLIFGGEGWRRSEDLDQRDPERRPVSKQTAESRPSNWSDQAVSEIPIHQVGPGAYEAKYPLGKKGSYIFRAVGIEGGGASRVLAYSYPDEYHFYPPNTELLRSISNETKGRFQPHPEDILASNGETTSLPTPLWPYLAALALILYVTDVLLRRVRLFE